MAAAPPWCAAVPSWRTSHDAVYPAAIPRTPPFAAVRRRVDNSMTCPDGSPKSAKVHHKHVRNVEVGSSSPLTSTLTRHSTRLARPKPGPRRDTALVQEAPSSVRRVSRLEQ